jgi:hypothetical protein
MSGKQSEETNNSAQQVATLDGKIHNARREIMRNHKATQPLACWSQFR